MKKIYKLFFLLLIFLFLNGCNPKENTYKNINENTYFPIKIGNKNIQLQIALTKKEHSKGLMYKTSIKENQGMIFLFKNDAKRSFWMKNTKIPLDIGFFNSKGELLEIHKLYPYNETPVTSNSNQIKMAIEMNQGWFKRNEIDYSKKINLKTLEKAIEKIKNKK